MKTELAFLCFFVLVTSYRKKNKKFKTDLITSFILLLLEEELKFWNTSNLPSKHQYLKTRICFDEITGRAFQYLSKNFVYLVTTND